MNINWIDILLVLVIAGNVALGWQRGFILGVLDLVRWLGSLLAGLFLYKVVAGWLGYVTSWTEVWNQPVAFLIVVVLMSLLIQFAGNAILRRIPKDFHKRSVNRIFGLLPGMINGLVMAAIVSSLLFSLQLSSSLIENGRNSVLADRFAVYTEDLETALVPIFEEPIKQTLNRRVTVEPGSKESIELPFKVDNALPSPTLEEQMLKLVNEERAKAGLKPLEADPELTEVARKHSADMFARGYFAHNTPEGKDPFDRMRDDKVKFLTAGENLALAPTLQIAHTGLMNSPGHRANILRPQFGRVGIGILDGGRHGLMISQEFRN